MAEPLLTVCVPTIGRLDYFPLTRSSLENQTFRDYEVLILDNESPKEAQKQLRDWADADSRVRILRAEPRIPMFENFNRGIREARGKYVVFFHDDDMYLPGFLEAYVNALEAHPSAAIAGGNWDYVGPNGELEEERRWVPATELWPGIRYIESLIRRGRNLIPMPGLVFRRSALGDGFDTKLPIHFGDFVLLMRLAETYDVAMVSECYVHIRRHTAQASQSMPVSRAVALRTEVLRDYLEEYATRHPADSQKISEFRQRIEHLHRIGMLWGWFSAKAPEEATACLDGLGNGPVDRTVSKALAVVEKAGIRQFVSKSKMIVIARRLGGYLGV